MSVRFKCSAELGDGNSWTVVDDVDILIELIREWAANNKDYVGEGFEVETVEMSDEEVRKLPDL